MLLKLAFRNMFRHKNRSLITLSTIASGCTAMIFVGGYMEDTYTCMRESYIYSHTGHMVVGKKGFWKNKRSDPYQHMIQNPDSVVSLLKNVPGVKEVTSRLEFSSLLHTPGLSINAQGQGIEPDKQNSFSIQLDRYQKWPPLKDGLILMDGDLSLIDLPHHALLGCGLAEKMGAKVGDPIMVMTSTLGGSVNTIDLIVQGIFKTSSKLFDDFYFRLPLSTTQELLRTTEVQSLVVLLNSTNDTNLVKAEFLRIFKENNLPLEVTTWWELNDFYQKTELLFDRMFAVLKLVVMLAVLLGIYSTLAMSVSERTVEIGTVQALGMRPSKVRLLFFLEGLVLGATGGIMGILLGCSVTYTIGRIGIWMPPPPGALSGWMARPIVNFQEVTQAFLLAIGSAALSSILPSLQSSRQEIAQALRGT